jgi:hypothetical protein
MLLKLKESIRNRGTQIRPPAVIDTVALGISDKSAHVLVSRGTAVHYNEVSDGTIAEVVDVAAPVDVVVVSPPDIIDLGDDLVPAVDSVADTDAADLDAEPVAKKSGRRK